MTGITEFDILFIQKLQGFGEGLLPVMKLFTALGYSPVYFIIALFICWCWNYSFGIRLAVFMAVSGTLNDLLKIFFHAPRPYMLDDRVIQYGRSESFGMPSGHAQGVATMWGYLAGHSKQAVFGIFVGFMIFFIGISRIYLGVHSPTQVLVGWGVGILLVLLFLSIEKKSSAWWFKQSTAFQIVMIVSTALVLIVIALCKLLSYRANPEFYDTAQYHFLSVLMTSSLLAGLASGGVLLSKKMTLSVQVAWWKQLVKLIIGLFSGVVLFGGFIVIETLRDQFVLLGVLVISASCLMGLWLSYFAPLLFEKLGMVRIEAFCEIKEPGLTGLSEDEGSKVPGS